MASRKEQKEQARAERIKQEQAAQSAQRRKKLLGYLVGGVLVVAIVGVLVAVVAGGGGGDEKSGDGEGVEVSYPSSPKAPPPGSVANLPASAKAAGCQVISPANEGSTHVDTKVVYKANPATSGNHDPVPADDGSYKSAPKLEPSVHTLEHGRIDIQFAPNSPDDVRAKLKSVYEEDPYHMLLFPNATKMPYTVAATAWDHMLGCKTVNDKVYDAIRAFKGKYRDKGPEFVP